MQQLVESEVPKRDAILCSKTRGQELCEVELKPGESIDSHWQSQVVVGLNLDELVCEVLRHLSLIAGDWFVCCWTLEVIRHEGLDEALPADVRFISCSKECPACSRGTVVSSGEGLVHIDSAVTLARLKQSAMKPPHGVIQLLGLLQKLRVDGCRS